jgi:hypothetical protein
VHRSSRQIAIERQNPWMPSPAPSSSTTEYGYEIDVSAGQRLRHDPHVRGEPQGTTVTHSHSTETERRIREAALDETLSATFPASDALSTLPNPDDDSVEAVSTTNEPESAMSPHWLKREPLP